MKTMTKTTVVIAVLVMALLCLSGCVSAQPAQGVDATSRVQNGNVTDGASTTVWKEVPVELGTSNAEALLLPFDPQKTAQVTDYVFSGTIIGYKAYEITWINDYGEQEGPYPGSVLEVKINKDYYGTSPVEGDIIKVYYGFSLSEQLECDVSIKKDVEYVFVTIALDEEFVNETKASLPEFKQEPEKYADVQLPGAPYSLLPIENGIVFLHRDYFSYNQEVLDKTVDVLSPLVPGYELAHRYKASERVYIALSEPDFEKELLAMFADPQALPTAEELIEMKKAMQ